MAYCEKWKEFVDGGFYCNAWQEDEEDRVLPEAGGDINNVMFGIGGKLG
jgi:glutamine cyclotransferase